MTMHIVAFADTHQFHEELKVEDADVVVCAGDVCRGGEREELDVFLTWFERLPHRHKIFVAGNHDGCLEQPRERGLVMQAHPSIHFLEDSGVVVDGVRFYGSPWTPEYHSWFFMKPRGAPLKERWDLIPRGTDVLITHGPPFGILDDAAGYRGSAAMGPMHAGCEALAAVVADRRPRLHLFGHIHGQRGVVDAEGVRYVNCTTNEAEFPAQLIALPG
jgi:predicted phosphohydrolase